jgi:hypothetical protein
MFLLLCIINSPNILLLGCHLLIRNHMVSGSHVFPKTWHPQLGFRDFSPLFEADMLHFLAKMKLQIELILSNAQPGNYVGSSTRNTDVNCLCRTLKLSNLFTVGGGWESVVGIAGLDNRGVGVRVPLVARIISYPCPPNWLWDPNHPRTKAAGAWTWPVTSN